MVIKAPSQQLLFLLQLTSSALPVGAYSYSEGLESLVDQGSLQTAPDLTHWLVQELGYGAVRLETAVMIRAYQAVRDQDFEALVFWNHWLSAAKETEELRQQSWQMGNSLLRLLQSLQPQGQAGEMINGSACNFAIAFGLAAAGWRIDRQGAALGYLHSWATNLISAGVRLIPLGQTQGQKILLTLHNPIQQASQETLILSDDDLSSCGWGLALASMTHETQYSRLFRS